MEIGEKKTIDVSKPELYINRELSWLSFNERVLEEALDESNPLGERLKFLAIFSSNLDEFFMVRVAGLKDQVKAKFNKPDNKSGLTPKQQLAAISGKNIELVKRQYAAFQDQLKPQLRANDIYFMDIDQLSKQQYTFVEAMFDEQIFPVLTPMAIDAYRPFPMLLNKSLNLAVLLSDEVETGKEKQKVAIVQVPAVLDRYMALPSEDGKQLFILLEEVISHFMDRLFQGFVVESVSQFRITRNADLAIHEEGASDLLRVIEKELKKRKWGAAVRLEVKKDSIDETILKFLLNVLEIHEKDVYYIDGPLDLTFLFRFYEEIAKEKEHLVYRTLFPQPPLDLAGKHDIFQMAATRDIFLHHPYESFEVVVDFLDQAATDPHVLAIKQTLYRVSGDSPIIDALKRAAENGKQVTVLVELKARFDEEKNVQWAKELERAGCHVIYGMTYLKTHSKITLVVRKKHKYIEQIVHLGTGNYNDETAKLYTDMGLITTKQKFGVDATNFFNYLSGYTEKPFFHHLSISPFDIRNDLLRYIDQEIAFHQQHGDGRIIAKMNSITDKKLIEKFYEASMAGVKIDLIVRGICCLHAGIKGISDHIRVRSIVGRFLEHSRIYYFNHHGEGKMFLSSADLMTRNMDRRVEILFPIYEGDIKKRILRILDIMLADNVKAREQAPDGSYHYVPRRPHEEKIDSQLVLYDMVYQIEEDD